METFSPSRRPSNSDFAASSDVRPELSRREWLRQSAAMALAGCAAGAMSASAAEPAAEVKSGWIDAHVHVWSPDTRQWPLAEGFTPDKMQPPSFTPEELLAHARPNGVARIVLIQMSFYRYDNRYMLDAMERFPGVFSGVGIVDLSAARPQDAMLQLAKQGVRGFRITPGVAKPDEWLTNAADDQMWETAADNGLAVCPLINPPWLASVDRMCQRFPKTRVVIDHFARVGIDGEIRSDELEQLCSLAKHPNVYVKTSAFYALGRKKAPHDDLLPMIRRVYEAYGPERLMWASDCPFQVENGHTYAASLELIRDRAGFLSSDDRQWLLRGTAEKVFFS